MAAKVTLRTIALRTGLSKYAVSRALSGKSGVSEATRARIEAVAAELGYKKPKTPRSKLLGVVFDDSDLINSELYMQIQSGAQREAQKLGRGIKIHWTHDEEDLAREAEECAALVMVGPHGARSLARAYKSGAPIVRIGWIDPLEPVDLVGGTDREAGAAVAAYLLNLGHRDIAYVHGDARYRGRMERLHGLREVMEQNQDARLYDLIWDETSSFAALYEELLAQGVRPTAFFCAHDGLAVTVVADLLSRGLRIPKDASIIGFGDFTATQQILPPLTTVRVAGHAFGAAAVRLLDARLKDKDFPSFPMRVLIPNTLIERHSVAAPRARIAAARRGGRAGGA